MLFLVCLLHVGTRVMDGGEKKRTRKASSNRVGRLRKVGLSIMLSLSFFVSEGERKGFFGFLAGISKKGRNSRSYS